MSNNKKTGRSGFFWLLAMVLALLFAMGWWAANRRAESLDASMRERLLRQTVAIADTLNPALARKLTFTAADKGTPAFECIREQMFAIGKTFQQRGIWSEALRGDKLFFGPETYPENDPIASQPGTEYQLPPPANLQVFKDKRPATIGPYTDEYGTFVSTLAPVLDPHTGEVLMVVAVDIIAGDWQSKLDAARILPLLTTLALILLFVAGALAIRWRNRRKRYEKFKFRKWIVAPTALALLGGLLIYVMFELWELDNESRQDMFRNMEQARSAYNQIITANVALLRTQIEHISGESTLLKAWRQRDRGALTALAQPVFEQLKREYGITHYYMIAPDRTCFLRAHEPGRHGDLIDRHTLLMAEKTGEDAWGAELGPMGAFTLRYVGPWKQDGAVIGYLELGVEIDNVGAKLAKDMDLNVLTIIRKEYTSREKFESGRRMFGFSGQWDAYPDFVVAHQTIPLLPGELSNWLERHYSRSAESDMANIRLGKKQFTCNVIHLFDAASRNVSDLILLRDVTAEVDAARNSLIFGLTLTALLFGGILVLLWSVAGAAERGLGTAIRKLRESEVRLDQLAEHGRIIAWEVDEQGLYSYVSQVSGVIFGYCPEEMIGRMHFYDLHPESGREEFRKAAFAIFAQKGAFRNMENAIQTKDGRQVWISTNGFPLLKADGTLRGYRGSGTDITERKKAELALRESEKRFMDVIYASQDAILLIDGERFVDCNEAVVKMLGYSNKDQFLMTHPSELSPLLQPDGRSSLEKANDMMRIAFEKGYNRFDWMHRKADGEDFSVEVSLTPIAMERRNTIHCVWRDISGRKRAELYRETGREVMQILNEPGDLQVSIQHIIAALKTRIGFDAVGFRLQAGEDFPYFAQEGFSRNFLLTENTLVEHAPDGGVCRDKDGNVNLECTCGLVISGKTDPALPIFTKGGSFWTGDSLPLLDLPAKQDPRLHPRNQCIHDGYASVALIPIRNKDRIVGLLHLNDRRKGCFTLETVELLEGIAAHIGAALMRKQSEEMLREINRQLEAATARALQANTAKSRFLAQMSHEIRAPLNAILGFSQLLQHDTELTASQKQRVETINRSGEHLLALLNDILELSKIEAGALTLVPISFDLRELLQDIVVMFRTRAQAKNLTLSTHGLELVPRYLIADEQKLRQVLINLLSNAVKYTVAGDICLRASVEQEGAAKSLRLVILVEDNGPGISTEEMNHLFTPFEQTSAGRNTGTGTGLGLAISRQFARLMGGDVTVTSEVGKGSLFRLEIPVNEGTEAVKNDIRQVLRLEPNQPSCRILVAEDNYDSRLLLVQMLGDTGFEVFEASNGQEAVEVFSSKRPQLILMDNWMPVMRGDEAIRQIRKSAGGGAVKIITLTANAREETRQQCINAGSNDFMGKPFRHSELFEKIRIMLGVRYVYAESPASKAAPLEQPPVLAREMLDSLPTELRRKMLMATISCRHDQLIKLIQQATTISPEIGGNLRAMAMKFDYNTLTQLLS